MSLLRYLTTRSIVRIATAAACAANLYGCATYGLDDAVKLDGRRYSENRTTAELCHDAESLGTVCNGGDEAEKEVLKAERAMYPRGVSDTTKRPFLALALSGGGQRAASSAIGFMQALDAAGVLEQVDILSTVSGGSYAGYWYVSKLIASRESINMQKIAANNSDRSSSHAYFERSYIYCNTATSASEPCDYPKSGAPPPFADSNTKEFGKHQHHLAHSAFLITQEQGTQLWGTPYSVKAEIMARGLMHAITMPVSWLANGVFDLRHDVGWLRTSYRVGLGRQYGLNVDAEECTDFGKCSPGAQHARGGFAVDLDRCSIPQYTSSTDTDPTGNFPTSVLKEFPYLIRSEICDLRWSSLLTRMDARKAQGTRVPFWVLNTTAMYGGGWKWTRGLADFLGRDLPLIPTFSNSLKETVYEFTPLARGSWSLGYFEHQCMSNPDCKRGSSLAAPKRDTDTPDLSGSVQLSGAAVDALPYGLNILLNAFNFGLGGYVDNPAVDARLRFIHGLLPFPLYLMHRGIHDVHAPSIYLSDGGHSGDNLGIYSALKRRPEVLIVFDAEHEGNRERLAAFESLQKVICRLKIENGWAFEFDKHAGLANLSALSSSQSPCTRNGTQARATLNGVSPRTIGFSVLQQSHPIFTGTICLRDSVEVEHCPTEDRVRLIYAKLSMDDRRLDCHGGRCGFGTAKVDHWKKLHQSRYQRCRSVENYKPPTTHSDLSSCSEHANGYSCETKYFYQDNIGDHEVSGCLLGDYPHHSTFDINYSPAQFAAYRSVGNDIGRQLRRCSDPGGRICVDMR